MDYFNYYGIDQFGMLFTFLGTWQIGNKQRIGFMLMMCGNTSWALIGFFTGSLAMIVANVIFFLMNLRAILKWL